MQLMTLLDPVALAIVGGGTVLVTILRTPFRDLVGGVGALRILWRTPFDAERLLRQVAALTRISRRHGVFQLDRAVIADGDVAAAVAMIVDGAEPDEVEALVRHRRRARIDRHVAAAELWAAAAETAPAMGMVGTLIGLARMFADMEDTSKIGAGMAVALMATLYGALLANLVFAPIAARLRAAGRIEASERAQLDAPLVALAALQAPRQPSLQSAA
ncbi:MotA/TolQ/ExbB proton channel family protein [Sphingomonas sp. KR1UV-12]|uniref:MotA/TolQ/ExbB proton channel family protein n=1 Tax=Sphingomonas aurea TaxID=3063994 RepID=A0ABT9EMK9_9SPHN|nr:MotA/TolQ/ExbB proton channel family protein [Sphingomonas sp. KR1UV-12]MDP1028194.1 MotA/TolQ/ExbB proton channel family protein [Sphingomonas sp. KR1UV-12]